MTGTRVKSISMFIAIMLALAITMQLDQENPKRLAFACSCMPPKPVQAAFEESNAVFSGKVVDLQTTDELYPSKVATFDVYAVWKGVSQDPVKITTGMGGADCGYPFQENEEYFVYAYGEEGIDLNTGSCTQTKPLDRAEKDLAILGKGSSTIATDSVEVFEERSMSIPFQYLIGMGAAIAGVIAFLTLRKWK